MLYADRFFRYGEFLLYRHDYFMPREQSVVDPERRERMKALCSEWLDADGKPRWGMNFTAQNDFEHLHRRGWSGRPADPERCKSMALLASAFCMEAVRESALFFGVAFDRDEFDAWQKRTAGASSELGVTLGPRPTAK
jgi:hypothetical protein